MACFVSRGYWIYFSGSGQITTAPCSSSAWSLAVGRHGCGTPVRGRPWLPWVTSQVAPVHPFRGNLPRHHLTWTCGHHRLVQRQGCILCNAFWSPAWGRTELLPLLVFAMPLLSWVLFTALQFISAITDTMPHCSNPIFELTLLCPILPVHFVWLLSPDCTLLLIHRKQRQRLKENTD